jgi:hypothetical protein
MTGCRRGERRKLFQAIYETRYHWPEDHAKVMIANWAAGR